MSDVSDSPLGRDTGYPRHYDPGLLFAIARTDGRRALGIHGPPPFIGHDRWHAYELGWLDARGKPQVATATLRVPADSPNLIESKSLKLYLNGFNHERLDDAEALRARIEADLGGAAGAPVTLDFGLPPVVVGEAGALDLDAQDIGIDRHGPPDPGLLAITDDAPGEQRFFSTALKSNCPVTGQPDWADVTIACTGPRIDPAGLLRYLASFRDHGDFHEQCVERIWLDLWAHCRPVALSVEARYTRRGGLDINPWRASPGLPPPAARRGPRQ